MQLKAAIPAQYLTQSCPLHAAQVVLIALFNMSIAMLAEYTTIGSLFKVRPQPASNTNNPTPPAAPLALGTPLALPTHAPPALAL